MGGAGGGGGESAEGAEGGQRRGHKPVTSTLVHAARQDVSVTGQSYGIHSNSGLIKLRCS